MITRRASHNQSGSRASYCHLELPRSEQRHTDGEARPHMVYLLQLLSDLGTYPSEDQW